MRGKVEPGALCMVTGDLWAGATVIVVQESQPVIIALGGAPQWLCRTADGIPRKVYIISIDLVGQVVHRKEGQAVETNLPEKYLMPLGPDAGLVTADEHAIKQPVVVSP